MAELKKRKLDSPAGIGDAAEKIETLFENFKEKYDSASE